MKTNRLLWCAAGLLVALTRAPAATHYVDAASTNPIAPYSSWANAAAFVQDAVDAAAPGDEILVTNGVYQTGARAVYGMSNRVAVTKPVTVRSVNGPTYTSIVGYGPVGDNAIRCAYLTNGAVLAGFTLTNGATQDFGDWVTNQSGGGVWSEGASATVSNCVLTGNSGWLFGGGAYASTLIQSTLTGNRADEAGGAAYGSTLEHCTITGNSAGGSGGGAAWSTLNYCALTVNGGDFGGGTSESELNNCTLTDNVGVYGGGAYSSTLNNCTLTGNYAYRDFSTGGGAAASTLTNCTLQGNWASSGGGASGSALYNCIITGNTGGGASGSSLNNCTLTGNHAAAGGGAARSTLTNCIVSENTAYEVGGGAYESTLYNCTLTGNWGSDYGGGAFVCTLYNCTLTSNRVSYYGGGASRCNLNNCTVTGNSAGREDGGAGGGTSECALNNCIVYYNSSYTIGANYFGDTLNFSCTTPMPESGAGNITNAPLFVDTNGWSNLRLQSNSPCINAGNNAYVTAATDLDGLPRIAGATVDMGADEFQFPASMISYAWLQQSGLPTDGSADYVDTDHDGHNNWQEWIAGTDPTNALSMLCLASPMITPTNVTFTWTSVTNRTYTLEQATNLGGAPAFSVLHSNLVGLPGTTSWTDTNAPVSSPRFYRLRVSP